jgi:hypothetical protein
MASWRPQVGEYPTCASWLSMLARCLDPKHRSFKDYGARGIRVCERWLLSFTSFLQDMGPRPTGLTIERIDGNGHYEPGNCRWATPKEQGRNRRNNVLLTARGRTQTISAWAEELGVSANALELRFRAGWPQEKIVSVLVGWRPPKKYATKFGAQDARRERLRREGRCTACGKDAAGRSRCQDCAAKRKKH